MRLKRTKQCDKCPWKKRTDPREIPDGYTLEKHRALRNTITTSENVSEQVKSYMRGERLACMSCHEHDASEEVYCIGWLANQLGEGNNIALRINMKYYSNAVDIETVGEQWETFDDMLEYAEAVHLF